MRRIRRRWAVAGVVLLLVVAGVVWGGLALRTYTGAAPPSQFYQPVRPDPSLSRLYPRVLGIAHNAGNNLQTTEAAKRYGADVIEADVISASGQLVAGRPQFWPWFAHLVFQGPTLAQAWDATGGREIKLDLKQEDRPFLARVVAFVDQRDASRRVLISSPDPQALLYLHGRLPDVTLLVTLANRESIAHLRADSALQRAIGGVSIAQGLVDAGLVHWLHSAHLMVVAWTVTDGEQMNGLVRMGVDGITTPNLAILRALS